MAMTPEQLDQLVEKAARALCQWDNESDRIRYEQGYGDSVLAPTPLVYEDWADEFKEKARAAIEAILPDVTGPLEAELAQTRENEQMALDALSKAADALQVLKALVKPPHAALTVEQALKTTRVINDGYDHAVALLVALGQEESGERRGGW